MRRIVIIGGGFAGFWSAAGARRKLVEAGVDDAQVEIVLIDKHDYHNIRVRNYEADPAFVVPLRELLPPIGARHVRGEARDIDTTRRHVTVHTADGDEIIGYDRLIHAAGSQVLMPTIPGLREHAFEVDSHPGARTLEKHLASLPGKTGAANRTVLIVGAGLTGIEAACEMTSRLAALPRPTEVAPAWRVILADSADIGSNMGAQAVAIINEALAALGVETRPHITVEVVDAHGVRLADGSRIDAATVVWCTGMRASALNRCLGVPLDASGRVEVDACLRVASVNDVFAAGDVARFEISPGHHNVMSCQHGRPMGRFAGHNAAADLLGEALKPLRIDWYTTVLDLGPWGAVYTEGWDRHVVATGAAAKQTKRRINTSRIYPPRTQNREDILAAAAAYIDTPPETRKTGHADNPDRTAQP